MDKKEEIILGSGDLYYMEFDGTNIPEDTVLEVEEKRAGHIRGGASIVSVEERNEPELNGMEY